MASNIPSPSVTETVVRNAEDRHPTLRLKGKDYVKKCEEANNRILEEIKKAMDANLDELKTFVKSKKPTPEKKTDEEYKREMEKFKHDLTIISGLLKEQGIFNKELMNNVTDYLLETWQMRQKGATEEEMKSFKEVKRRENCAIYEKKAQDLRKRLEQQLQQQPAQHPGQQSGQHLGQQSIQHPGQQSAQHPGQHAGQYPQQSSTYPNGNDSGPAYPKK
eukprot:GFUD01001626.1.p1 GENE.GFUD01001626.1~~GFUD01001626.1.p1  ORF type:complete len:219 (-),score=69.58 GFUD01001626.1:240-896(-)